MKVFVLENEFVVGHLSGNLYHYSAAEPNHSGVPVFVPVAQKDTYIVYQSRAAASTTSQSQGKGRSVVVYAVWRQYKIF